MAEVKVVKQAKQEAPELTKWSGFEAPLFRGSLFSMNPFALMRHFAEDMDRILGQTPSGLSGQYAWNPAIEVKEKEGKLLVTADLPGLTKDDIQVHIDRDTLVVEGERKQEKEEKREGYYHSERGYGRFYRSIQLPEGVNADQSTAQFDNGVLQVTVPIPAAKAKTQIPIQGEPKKAA